LYLVVLSIKQLAFILFQTDSQHFHLLGEAFDLNGLEDDYELDVFSEVGFLVVGEVLDA
jgi:hypothetical protein